MFLQFTVQVEVERLEGKFATREEIENALLEALESANPDTVEGDEGGQYEVTSFDVSHDDAAVEAQRVAARKASRKRSKARAAAGRL